MTQPKFAPLPRRTDPLPWKAPAPARDRDERPVGITARKFPRLALIGIGEFFHTSIPQGMAPERIKVSVQQAARAHRRSKAGQDKVFTIGRVKDGYRVLRLK